MSLFCFWNIKPRLTVCACEDQSAGERVAEGGWRSSGVPPGRPSAGPAACRGSSPRAPPGPARDPGFRRRGRRQRAWGWWCVSRTRRCWRWRLRTRNSRWRRSGWSQSRHRGAGLHSGKKERKDKGRRRDEKMYPTSNVQNKPKKIKKSTLAFLKLKELVGLRI